MRPGDRALDLGGTIRASDAAVTLSKSRSVLRTVGITRVANVTGLDHVGVPTWVAVRPLGRSLSVSQGKGLTHDLGRVSAVMEAIEIHHAEHWVPRGHRRSLADAAEDARYASPLLLPVRPDVTVDDASAVEWVEGRDLLSGASRFVPRDCIEVDSVSPRFRHKLFIGSTNGLASGNTRDEAVLHALCEVVERDQETFWYARKLLAIDPPPSRVRLDSIADAHCRGLLERCAAAGLEVAIWRASDEIDIPCFVCTLFDRHGRTHYPQRATGSGCHPYRRIALSRAITEALQSRLTHITGGRDDMYWSVYRDRLRVDDDAGRAWGDELNREPECIDVEGVAEAPPMETIGALLDWALSRVAAQGFAQVVVVELTQPDLGIPVVHVTVPGLEGPITKPGYTPGPRMLGLVEGRFAS